MAEEENLNQLSMTTIDVITATRPVSPSCCGDLIGVPPDAFDGTRSESKEFLLRFQLYPIVDEGNEVMRDPYNHVALAVSYMEGPKICYWVSDQLDKIPRKMVDTLTPMSKFPTLNDPKSFFESLIEAIEAHNPSAVRTTIGPHFAARSSIEALLCSSQTPAYPSHPTSSNAEISEIRNTRTSLTKAIKNIQKKVSSPPNKTASDIASHKSQAKSNPPYSAVVESRHPNHSLVVDLGNLELEIPESNWVRLEDICGVTSKKLVTNAPVPVKLVAVRWAAKGNLVVTGGTSVTPQALLLAAPIISNILAKNLQPPAFTSPTARANTKWSKISINGVPAGVPTNSSVFTLNECHTVLAAANPSYASLIITQRPSWVHRTPTSYSQGTISSLSVAFRDPDCSKLKALLTDRYLYIFGRLEQLSESVSNADPGPSTRANPNNPETSISKPPTTTTMRTSKHGSLTPPCRPHERGREAATHGLPPSAPPLPHVTPMPL